MHLLILTRSGLKQPELQHLYVVSGLNWINIQIFTVFEELPSTKNPFVIVWLNELSSYCYRVCLLLTPTYTHARLPFVWVIALKPGGVRDESQANSWNQRISEVISSLTTPLLNKELNVINYAWYFCLCYFSVQVGASRSSDH